MLYHIFHPTVYFPLWRLFWFVWMFFRRSNEWLFKDNSDNILYSMTYDSKTHPPVKHLYRAASEFRDRIATIYYISDTIWLIKQNSEETGWFFETPCFEHADVEYCWSGRSKLTDTAGTTIVEFKPSSWGYTKVGDLTMVEMDEDLREMILATMVAMDWRVGIIAAEEARRARNIAAEEARRAGNIAAEEARRAAEFRRICQEEYGRLCEEQNQKNNLPR